MTLASKLLTLTLCAAAALEGAPAQPWAHVYATTQDRSRQMSLTSVQAIEGATSSRDAIVLTDRKKQEIDGFGYAITYSSCVNLLNMSPSQRRNLLVKTFSPTEGYGVNYVRISIGCCDFSSREYSLCDSYTEGNPLAAFGFTTDETAYVIPVLKEILSINPGLKIIAAPWTPPLWMKVRCDNHSANHWRWADGSLNPNHYRTYGEYFVKFIRAMAAEGINIHAVSPQNEPLNHGNVASCYMPWEEQADFVKTGLAPALKQAGLTTKIYLYDHNYNYDDVWGQDDYPVKAFNRMGTDFEGAELVVGAAYHNYGGWAGELDNISAKLPGKELLFTEASIGEWNDGRNLQARLLDDFNDLVLSTVSRGCRGALVWNFLLDDNKGPHMWGGGCQTCYGAIDINSGDYSTLTYNSHYFVMAHASAAVRSGAHRIETEGWWTNDLDYMAFANTDGTRSMLFRNMNHYALNVKVTYGGKTYTIPVPRRSLVTAVLNRPEAAAEGDVATGNTPVPGAYPQLVLTGDFTSPGWKLEREYTPWFDVDQATGIYTINEYAFNGRFEFKVTMHNTWFPQWGSSAVVTDTNPSIVLTRKQSEADQDPPNTVGNLYGRYRVTFDYNTNRITFTNVTASETISVDSASCSPAVYYNLQGMPVANPRGGIFIRMAGGEVDKIYVE